MLKLTLYQHLALPAFNKSFRNRVLGGGSFSLQRAASAYPARGGSRQQEVPRPGPPYLSPPRGRCQWPPPAPAAPPSLRSSLPAAAPPDPVTAPSRPGRRERGERLVPLGAEQPWARRRSSRRRSGNASGKRGRRPPGTGGARRSRWVPAREGSGRAGRGSGADPAAGQQQKSGDAF